MVISNVVRRLAIIAVILTAATLAYGYIDANGYREGYKAGYGSMGKLVDAACINGLVLDQDICDKAEAALYEDDSSLNNGLAEVSSALNSASVRRAVRAAKKKTMQPVVDVAPVAPAEPTPPPLPEATQKILTRIQEAQGLPDTYCSQYTDKTSCIEKGSFKCSMDTSACAFKPLITGFRSVDTTQIAQYVDCFKPEILDRISVAKRVGDWCVAIDGTSRMVSLSNTTDVRTTGEQARSPEFRDKLAKSGISASTDVTPIAVTVTKPPCYSMPYIPGQMMDMSKCDPTPPSGMMMPMQGYMPPHASLYIPSTLAQFIDIITSLFRFR